MKQDLLKKARALTFGERREILLTHGIMMDKPDVSNWMSLQVLLIHFVYGSDPKIDKLNPEDTQELALKIFTLTVGGGDQEKN